ncbi:MAG TPA: Calx-beta domain-containing protein [Thermoanaerobaculia bacterium]|jgi:plastocyanin|nr:Calx-beta domain-containing protein [Thermoanaerobaculia bacterium]
MPYRLPLKLAALTLATVLGMAGPSWAATHTVTVGPDTAFHPATLNIAVGDTVVWTNAGGFHDVHADDNSFSRDPSSSAWTFSHTFTVSGTEGYHCTVHGGPGVGMHGTINVQGAGGGSQPGSLRFSLANYPASEGGGSVNVVVQRINGDDGVISVQYSATAGSATAGQDFTAVSGALTWGDNDDSAKTFSVPVLNDNADEANETVLLTLSNPTGGAALDANLKTAVLTIQDDDTSGGGGNEGFLTTPAFPNFRFRLRIYQGDQFRLGARENACLPETLCVSGAIPGRSEVFVRIIGPRPNGFLWPTIVRFTPSRVVVEIQQISTGITKTYDLPAVPPDSDSLSGLQDRMGFLP